MATVLVGSVVRGTAADNILSGDVAAWGTLAAAASADVNHIYVHPKVANAALSTLNVALYANSAGNPGARLTPELTPTLGAVTSAIPGGTTSAGLVRYDLATPLAVTSGTLYHLAIRVAGEQFDWQGDASPAGPYKQKASGTLPDPWGTVGSSFQNAFTIFATDAPIPQVVAESVLADTGNTTSHNVPFPSPAGGILADDLLIAFVGMDGTAAMGFPLSGGRDNAGWTEIVDTAGAASALRAGCAYMWAAGGETGTFTLTTASEGGGTRVMVIRGAHPTTPPAVSTTADSGTAGAVNPNPPSLNPAAWDTPEPTLWIGAAGNDGNIAITAGPTGFVDFGNTRWANTAGAGVATAWRLDPAASVDPGTFTMTSEQWIAWTVAVRSAEPAPPPSGVTVRNLAALGVG